MLHVFFHGFDRDSSVVFNRFKQTLSLFGDKFHPLLVSIARCYVKLQSLTSSVVKRTKLFWGWFSLLKMTKTKKIDFFY